jgi:NAD(P)-dependent dehydrogenase (short-subunit alcohol dehydrogenase family)
LGRAHALELAKLGATVAVNDLDENLAATVVSEIEAGGRHAFAHCGSVADEQQMHRLVDTCMSRTGRLDAIVMNAGNLRARPFEELSLDDYRAVMEVHYFGTVILVRAAWSVMKLQDYGRIVLTSSASGLYGTLFETTYSPAKAAVLGFMRALLRESPPSIRINAIAPLGATEMTSGFWNGAATNALQPERVSPLVAFLASEAAPNGQVIAAGGGSFLSVHIAECKGFYLSDAELAAGLLPEKMSELGRNIAPTFFHRSGQQVDRLLALAGLPPHDEGI